jgi:hypothetical protein
MRRGAIFGLMFLAIGGVAVRAAVADEPRPEKYLVNHNLADSEKQLALCLAKSPQDDSLRFALGAAQFLRGLERLGQNLYHFGLREQPLLGQFLPIVRLPVGGNPQPEMLTYEKARQIIATWVADFERAEATLAAIKDPAVALPLELNLIKLDISGDGIRQVSLVTLVAGMMSRDVPHDLLVRFDRADVAWLRGYCHLLAALGDVILAHDGRELFEHSAQVFFTNVESPYTFLGPIKGEDRGMFGDLPDLIALVHLIHLSVVEPARMQAALGHIEHMLACSREMWRWALAETDNDHEWIPNPKQKSAVGLTVTQQMIDSWLTFLDEAESIFQGKRLVPFWRNSTKGVNLRRVFTEPRTFDLVLWVQGAAAAPYLEDGPKTRTEVWDRLFRTFEGDLFLFAAWFN